MQLAQADEVELPMAEDGSQIVLWVMHAMRATHKMRVGCGAQNQARAEGESTTP